MTIEELNRKIEEVKKEGLEEQINGMCFFEQYNHLIRHINVQDGALKRRIIEEDKKYSTSFIGDENEVLEMIHNTLVEEIDEIACWLISTAGDWSACLVLCGDITGNVSGSGYAKYHHNWDNGSVKCTSFNIVIEKPRNIHSDEFFVVLTAYPEFPELNEDGASIR